MIVVPQYCQNGSIVDDAVDFTRKMTVNGLLSALAHGAASVFQQVHRERHFECSCEISQPDMNRLQ